MSAMNAETGQAGARALARAESFRSRIASLSRSDLCEILQAHSADELVRICNLQASALLVKP